MKVSMSWIGEFVDIADIDPKQYASDMTMTGSMVEGIENKGDEIKNVVVGKILSCEKHPNADKLQVCQVDVGETQVQIVTGAKNIKAGDRVPVALHKSKLPGGVEITKGKLRGVESCGMMCSHSELGMDLGDYAGACEDGILIIQEDIPAGTPITKALKLDENIVEFEITSNRPDCLSVIGLARETAVTYGRELKLPQVQVKGGSGNINDEVSITVENMVLCPRYTGRVVKNVKIGPSPAWMREHLTACGIRSINNIVDITNYVLLEYGQPMHAFDMSYLKGKQIIVRNAKEGEKITTLDGVERALDPSMLVIADAQRAVAVAGVMGGENSEIVDSTTTLLFESANFNGVGVRRTAKKLGMRTEASSRYEKGLDPNMTLEAVNRACQLVELLGAGEVVDGVIDINNASQEARILPLRPDKINAFLGCDIQRSFMESTLEALGFTILGDTCMVPSYRADVEGEADLAEEIARFYGYEKIPSTLLRGDTTPGGRTAEQLAVKQAKEILSGIGMYEIMTYSFTSPKIFGQLLVPKDSALRNTVVISNPLGEENSVMRTTMIASMMETLTRNYNYRAPSAKLFELGTVYIPVEGETLPFETDRLTMGMYGSVDFYDIKGAVEDLLVGMNVKKVHFKPETENPTFHPGRTALVYAGDRKLGILGELHPNVLGAYGLPVRAYVAELDFVEILAAVDREKQYKPLPKYPAVTRDIALLVDEPVPVGELEEAITAAAGNLLEEIRLFDVYRGEQVAQGKKSVAFALVLRSSDHTLGEEEINAVMKNILEKLEKQTGALLR